MANKTDRNSRFTQHRFNIQAADNRIDGNTVRGVVIATEEPVSRWWGEERFVISEESIDLREFREIGINLLDSHDPALRRMGTVSNPVIDGNKVRADITFDKNYKEAVEILESVRDNQRQDLSVGYERREVLSKQMGESESFSDEVRKFKIIEVSVVGMGADSGAGFGRKNTIIKESSTESISEPDMTKDNEATKVNQAEETRAVASSPDAVPAKADMKAFRSEWNKIRKMARNNDVSEETLDGWLEEGLDYNSACIRVAEAKKERGQKETPTRFADNIPESAKGSIPAGDRGRRVKLEDTIGGVMAKATGERLSRPQEFALEVSKALGGNNTKRFHVPFSAVGSTRAFEAQTAGETGDNLITDVVNMSMLKDFLYKQTVIGQLGIQVITGQVNDLSIPRINKSTTANWVSENSPIPDSDIGTETFSLTPKTLASRSTQTNLSRVQNPAANAIISNDMLRRMAIAIEAATLRGDAGDSKIPTGVLATSSIVTSRTGNTTARKYADALKLFSDQLMAIRKAEIAEVPAFVTGDEIINYLRTLREGNNGPYLWTENRDMSTVMSMPGRVFGSPIYRSSNLGESSNNYTVVCGVWRHLLQAYWGNSFVLTVGESNGDYENDRMSLRLVTYMDVGISYPQAFKAEDKISL